MPEEAAAQDQVMERKESLDPLSPPASLPSPSLPSSRLHLLGSTPSHQFLPHFPALPGFSLEVPSPSEEQMLSPIVSPPVTAASRDGPATRHPSPQPGGLGL